MSSSPTVLTSTTASSTSSLSPAEAKAVAASRHTVAVIACGAIAQPCADIVVKRGWPVDVHPLPPLLHNRPGSIAGEVEKLAVELAEGYESVSVAYADCGTYGALDEVCSRLGLTRLAGLHCYDVFAGPKRLQQLFEEQPGTYVLTDFLVRSFRRTVLQELGLDRYPELRDTYFANYTRVVWLAQQPTDELKATAQQAAETLGLPLTVVDVGTSGLEQELARLLGMGEVTSREEAGDEVVETRPCRSSDQ
ncbi:MAG: DUF1638 domain-containing protein [Nocardioidaceae bacterium]